MNWETAFGGYTRVKHVANENLLSVTANSTQCSGRSTWEGNFKKTEDICIQMANSHCCMADPNTALLSNYAAAKSLQSCPTLFDPIDGSPPGSPVPGILQARTLYSNKNFLKMKSNL